jgi:RNA polymerase sigma-70 factor, ECF subfamily
MPNKRKCSEIFYRNVLGAAALRAKDKVAMGEAQAIRQDWALASDTELVAGVGKGVAEAFAELMQRYSPTLYRAARSITGNDAEAEDVTQESWLRAYANLGKFRGESRLVTWLVRITLNEALGRKRRAPPILKIDELDRRRGADVMLFPTAPIDPEVDLSRTQVSRLLERAIDTLPAPYRIVFILRIVEEMSVEDVALQLGVAEITVRTRTYRARGLLRKALEKKLSSDFKDVFPFAGARCQNLRARVLAKIKEMNERQVTGAVKAFPLTEGGLWDGS